MPRANRGWKRVEGSRTAREVDIRYGRGLLLRESANWPRYVVVATRTPWSVVQAHLARTPLRAGIVRYLDWSHLEDVTRALPDEAELVVGVGGGVALDASKYAALRRDLPLILVPTIVSTGAIIHGAFAKWKGRYALPPVSEWPYCDCEHALVDYDLVLNAPGHLNTAGLGDILCGYAGIAEWRHNAESGAAPKDYSSVVEPVLAYYRSLADEFPKTVDSSGRLTADSIKLIMTALQERDERALRNPHAPGADHVLPITIEHVSDKGFVHGELTALGAVIVAWLTRQHEELLYWLDQCMVRYRPGTIGLSRRDLARSLRAAPEHLASRDVDSIVGRTPVTGAMFDELWAFLNEA